MLSHLNHLNIILADDDEDDRSLFRDAIKKLQISSDLHMLNDGEKLMTYLCAPAVIIPDIIFLDLHMPRKNGIQCIHEIRELTKYNQVPIVMFTLSGLPPHSSEPDAISTNLYVKKADTFPALISLLAGILIEDGKKALSENTLKSK